ncbi:unnamed protein product [Adineta steineri]|uniref:Uncharacterized protein n=1 Tax=Adineta steineri TaxID=433720 RepID=A0A818RZV6_9BILA|nr:unnamed protein product [Adineta steineri]CAF1512571.1 unnamed protein product [Adineta steineri]CAF3660518.1 unnamed protein product [Adineta steineri]CAF3665574.1 unnamed protein product [Adineta steineri]
MVFIRIRDKKNDLTVCFNVNLDNIFYSKRLSSLVPSAVSLSYDMENVDDPMSMNVDRGDNFIDEWNSEIIYYPVYADDDS